MVTDGWPSYMGVTALGYVHEPHSQRAATTRGEDDGALFPGAHPVASLAKRWVLGTHQGSVGDPHLQSYRNEFVFHFNRRTARSRGLLFYRVLGSLWTISRYGSLSPTRSRRRWRRYRRGEEDIRRACIGPMRIGPGGRLAYQRKSGQVNTPSRFNSSIWRRRSG